MLRGAGNIALFLALMLSIASLAGEKEDPDEVHAFMDSEKRCEGCHQAEHDGEDLILDPHIFVLPVIEICHNCHPPKQIGRSHPVNVDPRETLGLSNPPEALPLHWSKDQRARVVTCGTCHNPHMSRFSEKKIHSLQKPFRSKKNKIKRKKAKYLTYFLRITSDNPRDGYMALCQACHPDM